MTTAIQYVTLGAPGTVFAVPVGRVRQILDLQPALPLPRAPVHFLGLIDLRGHSVPVIDLRRKLGMPDVADTADTRILVLDVDGGQTGNWIGIKTDQVFEVTHLDPDSFEDPQQTGLAWCSGVVAGIAHRNGSFVTVLDTDHLLAPDVAEGQADPKAA